jgi:hypothetical protein
LRKVGGVKHEARHGLVHYREMFERIARGRLGLDQDDVRFDFLDALDQIERRRQDRRDLMSPLNQTTANPNRSAL